MTSMGARERKIAAAAVGCVALLVFDRLIWTPASKAWSTRSQEINRLSASLDKAKTLLQQADRWQQRQKEMEASSLPADLSKAENTVLQTLNGWARSSGIEVESMRPRWREVRDEPTTMELRISANGSLRSITSFMYAIETGPLPFRCSSVDISTRDPNGQLLSLELQLSGIVAEPENSHREATL